MESNNNDYVLILEDRTEVKNEAEVGKLSVVSNIDEKGKLKPAPLPLFCYKKESASVSPCHRISWSIGKEAKVQRS